MRIARGPTGVSNIFVFIDFFFSLATTLINSVLINLLFHVEPNNSDNLAGFPILAKCFVCFFFRSSHGVCQGRALIEFVEVVSVSNAQLLLNSY